MVMKNNKNIDYIPSKYRTCELYQKLVEDDWRYLENVPNDYKCPQTCEIAFKNCDSADILRYLPSNYITKDLCIKIINTKANVGKNLDRIPDNVMTSLLDFIIEKYPKYLNKLHKFISKEFYETKLKPNKEVFDVLGDGFKTYYELGSMKDVDTKITINEKGEFVDNDGNLYKACSPGDDYEVGNISEYARLAEMFYFEHNREMTALEDKSSFLKCELTKNPMLIKLIPKENQDDYIKIYVVGLNKDMLQYV
jgi:hypothetical protein